MGLNAALVDKARVVEKRGAGRVVDGETIYGDVTGPWFKVRIQLGTEGESIDGATEERSVHRTPSLLVALRDELGDPVILTVEDRLEVVSRELPQVSTEWDVIADPQPLRKRRRVKGWIVTLRKVFVHGNPG